MQKEEALYAASLDVLKSAIRDSGQTQKAIAAQLGIPAPTLSKRLSPTGKYESYAQLDMRIVMKILVLTDMPLAKFSAAVDRRTAEILREN